VLDLGVVRAGAAAVDHPAVVDEDTWGKVKFTGVTHALGQL
jgi:hypothetical protein